MLYKVSKVKIPGLKKWEVISENGIAKSGFFGNG